jgi:hypothetical protein
VPTVVQACDLPFHRTQAIRRYSLITPPRTRFQKRWAGRRPPGGVVGWAVIAALVRSVMVEVPGVLVEDGRGVAFVVDEDSAGALGSDAADEPFGVAVARWGARWDLDRFDAFRSEHRLE